MSLPIITSDNPITTPATDEVVYDAVAVPQININYRGNGLINIGITYCPMNGQTGDMLTSATKRFRVIDAVTVAADRATNNKNALLDAINAVMIAAKELINENEAAQ